MPGGRSRFCNFNPKASEGFKALDFFGERIDLTFQKKPYFQTNLGAFVSLICMCLIAGFLAVRTTKLASDSEPFFSSTS